MKKRVISVSIYIVCLAAIAIWLYFSNAIIMRLSGSSIPQKVNLNDYMSALHHGDVFFSADIIQSSGNLFEDLGLYGWSFVETESDNSERYTSFLLQGETNCYELRCDHIIGRQDVVVAYPNKKIPNGNVGYSNDFTTISMEDGLYEVWIYCWENEVNYGLTDTGIWLEKSGNTFSKVKWESQTSTPLTATSSETIKLMVDSTCEKDGYLEISGWALKEGEDCGAQEVYLELTNMEGDHLFYTTDDYLRADVAEAFGDAKYKMSGFQAKFPLPELPDDEWAIRAWIKNGESVWGSKPYYFQKAKHLTQNYQPTSKREVMSCVDSITANETEIKIQGWAFAKELDTENQRVFIAFSNAEKQLQFTARSWERPDVAAKYGSQYGRSGYVSYLPINDLPDGSWDMQLILKCGEEIVTSKPYAVEKDGENIERID